MPVTEITLLPGYSEDVRARLVNHVSKAVRSVIAAPPAGVTTAIFEAATYQRDGRVFTSGNAAHPPASMLVEQFLKAMASRDVQEAERYLAPEFSMVFPGGKAMGTLAEMIQWSSVRYQAVQKTFEGFDEAWTDSCTVVYARGTLSGNWLDGEPFSGIRFIDRFEVVDGLLVRKDVWNDIGESLQKKAIP